MRAPFGLLAAASSTCRLIDVDSASAAASETPGLRRPTTIIQVALGIRRRSLAAQNAMSSSQGTSRKPFGITPITVRGSPSTWNDVPITSVRAAQPALPGLVGDDDRRASFCLTTSSKSSDAVRAAQEGRHADDGEAVHVHGHLGDSAHLVRPRA